jgi:uncharacterized protein (DUF1499 family)
MGCSGQPTPDGAGFTLAPCPASPNCVCSDATDATHAIAPLEVIGDPEQAWQGLIGYLEAHRSFTIVEQRANYLRAEARTRWLRFVDGVEFQLQGDRRHVAMRSASRVGYSDFGANRRRLEQLRRVLTPDAVSSRSQP